jgi:hypothetical protein
MLRHLTHRLPIMTTPKWVSNRTQPIGIRDVLYYLRQCAQLPTPVDQVFDIGGPQVLSYADMMQKFAALSGLRKRLIIQVPVLTPKLSSLWIGFVTPVPISLAKPLVESLISEVVADPNKSIDALIPKPAEGLLTVEEAIGLALTRTAEHSVDTRWSDAAFPTAPWQKAQSDPDWAGEMMLRDLRVSTTDVPAEFIWQQIEQIGGDNGWFGAGWLWYLRGVLDRMLGGVGLRRGRRDPEHRGQRRPPPQGGRATGPQRLLQGPQRVLHVPAQHVPGPHLPHGSAQGGAAGVCVWQGGDHWRKEPVCAA